MRPAILVLSAALMLEGCSTSLAPTLPSRGPNAPASAPIALAFSGSVASAATAPPAVAAAVPPGASVPTAASPAIDLGALAQIVARLPRDLYRFEVDLFICAGAIVAIGIVNAFLIAALLAKGRREARPVRSPDAAAVPSEAHVMPAMAVDAPVEIVTAAATVVELEPDPEVAVPACACGAAIGARSKTGRCRRCATASRPKRPRREVATARA